MNHLFQYHVESPEGPGVVIWSTCEQKASWIARGYFCGLTPGKMTREEWDSRREYVDRMAVKVTRLDG